MRMAIWDDHGGPVFCATVDFLGHLADMFLNISDRFDIRRQGELFVIFEFREKIFQPFECILSVSRPDVASRGRSFVVRNGTPVHRRLKHREFVVHVDHRDAYVCRDLSTAAVLGSQRQSVLVTGLVVQAQQQFSVGHAQLPRHSHAELLSFKALLRNIQVTRDSSRNHGGNNDMTIGFRLPELNT